MGLAQSLESSKCSRNIAFYRHHYRQSDENSWLRQKQNGPCLPSSEKEEAREEVVGAAGRRGRAAPQGRGLLPRAEQPAPVGWGGGTGRQGGWALLPIDRWRGHGESGSSMAENVGTC